MAMWRVSKPCINQDTGERMLPGDIVELSAFEFSRLQAEQAIVPYVEKSYDTQSVVPIEIRRGRRRRAE